MTVPGSALVTGGATGLGAEVADLLVSGGWSVTATQHDRSADDRAPGVTVVPCDLADTATVDRLVDGMETPPSALVHCATVFERRPLGRGTRRPIDVAAGAVHLTGVDRIIRRFSSAGHRLERIVLVGSAGAAWGGTGLSVYGSHKAAMRGYVRGLAEEWRDHGTVNLVEPGPMATELATDREAAWRRDAGRSAVAVAVAPPRQVARTVAFLLSASAGNTSGAVLPVDGGLMAGVAP